MVVGIFPFITTGHFGMTALNSYSDVSSTDGRNLKSLIELGSGAGVAYDRECDGRSNIYEQMFRIFIRKFAKRRTFSRTSFLNLQDRNSLFYRYGK